MTTPQAILFVMLILAPVVDRVAPDRLEVTGAQYAWTSPESELVEGVELLYGIGWAEPGQPIAFQLDPMQTYQVYSHEEATSERTDTTVTPDRETVIDHIIEQRIIWERAMDSLLDGTHPGIDAPVDYFEIREGIIRVYERIGVVSD